MGWGQTLERNILQDVLLHHGLLHLFGLSFLASTLVPLGSEWLLVAMVLQGGSLAELVLTATVGNCLGACTSYLLGLWGADWVQRNLLRLDQRDMGRAEKLYRKYGSWSLLLSWLPIVGDPLCFLGGSLRVQFLRFVVLVTCGKFARYLLIGWLAAATLP